MRLQFLGSGDAFGSGGRFNTCFHVERATHGNLLIDCGASSMVAIRKWQVEPNAISTVLVSHLHGDHFAGLPFFLLDAQLVSRRTVPLLLAGPPGFRDRLMTVMEAMFAGSTQVQRKFALEIRELELHERVEMNGLAVTPYLMKHFSGAPSYALRIETEGKVLTYSGDTEWVEELVPAGTRRRPLHLRGLLLRQGDEVPHRLQDPGRSPAAHRCQAYHRHPHERRAPRPRFGNHARSRA
jgi:ribonuclease BN (tRNA processing enzyme)